MSTSWMETRAGGGHVTDDGDNEDSDQLTEGRNTRKHTNGNEALNGEEMELLLNGQGKQPQCCGVDCQVEQQRNQQSTGDQKGNGDTEMTTYSPHKFQLKHQTSEFQLDCTRSPGQMQNPTVNSSDSVGQTTITDEASGGGTDEHRTTFNDASGKTTNALPTPLYPLPYHHEEEYKGPKIWRDFVNNWPISSQPLAILVMFMLLWIIAYAEVPQYAAPETTVMRLAFLIIGAQITGSLITFVHLPDIVGMLLFSVVYTNLGLANFTGYESIESILRELALINIMLLAGLGLDGGAFKKLWMVILRLTLVPTIAEVAVVCVLGHYLLSMPWFWGILLGLVVTAVSPNVVVTVMLKLKEEQLGLNNGIHTLIYAMTTCNDIVSIFTFGCILGVIFNQGKFSDQVLQGPVGIVVGIVYGYVFGLLLVYLPSKKSKYVDGLRFTMAVLGGCVSVMGSRAFGYPSAGALGCVTVAFVAGTLWRRQQKGNGNLNVTERLDLMWKFLKPVSFALIGKEIRFSVLDGKTVAYGLGIIVIGCLFRVVTAYLSTAGADLKVRERAYITLSGMPKATVQAALGPIALDLARHLGSGEEILSLASDVLVISVIAIIATAPLGAILMLRLAPLWLEHGENSDETGEVVAASEQSQEDIAIITVGDNRIVMDSSHTNVAFDSENNGR